MKCVPILQSMTHLYLTLFCIFFMTFLLTFDRRHPTLLPLSPHPCQEGAGEESVLKVLGGMLMSSHAKYWIYVCGGMFIMVSFAGKLVGYKIIYMLLFLLCLCLYQVGTGLQTTIICILFRYLTGYFKKSYSHFKNNVLVQVQYISLFCFLVFDHNLSFDNLAANPTC